MRDTTTSPSQSPSSPAAPARCAGEGLSSPWLMTRRTVRRPRYRLICLPYAGGGAGIFRDWPDLGPADVEIAAVQLPGRETRLRETLLTSVDQAIPPLARALSPASEPCARAPLVLFGHSLGASIAAGLADHLAAAGHPPALLVVSGRRAPHLPAIKPPVHHLPDAELRAEIARMGGTPPEILAHDELMAMVLPILRADFTISETATREADAPLPCPVLAFAGNSDDEADEASVAAWETLSPQGFTMKVLPGDHFFLHHHAADMIAEIDAVQSRLP